MASAACLFDPQEQGVAITIEAGGDDLLPVTRCLTLAPELLAGARPVTGKARAQGFFKRSLVHPGQHEYFVRIKLLRDGGDQAILIERQTGNYLRQWQRCADMGAFESG